MAKSRGIWRWQPQLAMAVMAVALCRVSHNGHSRKVRQISRLFFPCSSTLCPHCFPSFLQKSLSKQTLIFFYRSFLWGGKFPPIVCQVFL
jgi:hypothetical protein